MGSKRLSEKFAEKDIFNRGLSLAQTQNRGTRILTSRMGTRSNSPAKTFQVTAALAQHFDAVRVMFPNTSLNLGIGSYLAKVAVTSSIATNADINNSSATWYTVTMEGNTALSIPVADEAEVTEYAYSDWIGIQSLPRTDGGELPIVTVRMQAVSIANVACYGDGTDNFTNWATHPSGRVWIAREQVGDYLTTTTGFTSTTNVSQSPIAGIQYISRGKVVTVMACGDSITDGRGTYLGEGFIMPACVRLSDMNDVAIEYSNLGWSGQIYQKFHKRALNALLGDLAPDIFVFPNGSPNDIVGEITSSVISNFTLWRQAITEQCFELGIKPIIWTMLPSNTNPKNYGASDSLRVAYNSQVLTLSQHDISVVDTATVVSGASSGGQIQMAPWSNTDGIHPNDSGNLPLSEAIEPAIAKFMRYPSRRSGKKNTGKPFPVYTITGGSITMSRSGTYIFAGGSIATASFPILIPQMYKREPLRVHMCNRGSANVTVTSTAQFSMNSVVQTGMILYPGASCILVYDGNVVVVLYPDFPSTTQNFTPLTGTTVAPVNNKGQTIAARITPAGTLANLTITFPPSPVNGQVFEISCSQIVSSLTCDGGSSTVADPLSSIAAGGFASWRYSSTGTTWFRRG